VAKAPSTKNDVRLVAGGLANLLDRVGALETAAAELERRTEALVQRLSDHEKILEGKLRALARLEDEYARARSRELRR
jgi:hypothetical protein